MEVMAQLVHRLVVALVIFHLAFENVRDEFGDGGDIGVVDLGVYQAEIARDVAKHAIDPGAVEAGSEVGRGRRRSQRAAQWSQVAVLAQ